MISTKIDKFEIAVADNGFIVEFNKHHGVFEWEGMKLVYKSLEEVFDLIQREIHEDG